MKSLRLVLALTLLLPAGAAFAAEAVTNRYSRSIEAFEAQDAAKPPPAHPVLFLGSSSFTLWKDVGAAFPDLPVLNRGFGGSHLSDQLFFFDRVAKPYAPSKVVIYCGENDLAGGKSVEQVVADGRALFERLEAAVPNVPILYVAMKPSLARWKLWPKFQEANALFRDECAKKPNRRFVDVTAAMLGADGQPLPDIWKPDGLHMNEKGYALWVPILRKALDEAK
jgi:lysophospholipase L1-like esterase